MNNKVLIVIPLSNRPITDKETISLIQLNLILKNYPKTFIAPNGYNFIVNEKYKSYETQFFSSQYFGSTEAHNQLLLSKEFYERVKKYEFILIYHLDAFVFKDDLAKFCELGYDYIGAPVFDKSINGMKLTRCMNGGFSLRKVKKILEVLNKVEMLKRNWITNEDIFFSWCGEKKYLQIAPPEVARSFSFEARPQYLYKKNHEILPFGCHAWDKYDYDFYKPFIEAYGFRLGKYQHDGNLDLVYRKKRLVEKLFSRIIRSEKNQIQINSSFKNLLEENGNFAIFGCGQDGQKLYDNLKSISVNVICFFDSIPRKWGNKANGMIIREFKIEYVLGNNIKILVATKIYSNEIMEQLKSFGLIKNVDFFDAIELEEKLVNAHYQYRRGLVE